MADSWDGEGAGGTKWKISFQNYAPRGYFVLLSAEISCFRTNDSSIQKRADGYHQQ